MPKTPQAKATHHANGDIKPYASSPRTPSPSSASSTKDTPSSGIKSESKKPKAKAEPAKPWTGDERKALLLHALKNGPPGSDGGWNGVVEGRTGAQCRNAWRKSVLQRLLNACEK